MNCRHQSVSSLAKDLIVAMYIRMKPSRCVSFAGLRTRFAGGNWRIVIELQEENIGVIQRLLRRESIYACYKNETNVVLTFEIRQRTCWRVRSHV